MLNTYLFIKRIIGTCSSKNVRNKLVKNVIFKQTNKPTNRQRNETNKYTMKQKKQIKTHKRVFKQFVSGILPGERNKQLCKSQVKTRHKSCAQAIFFKCVFNTSRAWSWTSQNLGLRSPWHDMDSYINEAFHSTQLVKAIVTKFLNVRLKWYGQEFSLVTKKKDVGKRQQLNKLIIFKGL